MKTLEHSWLRTVGLVCLIASACTRGVDPTSAEGSSSALSGETVVSLTFDDGTDDHSLAGDMLAAHGMKGTFYINSGRLGLSGYLSTPAVLQLTSQGHEIGGHTVSHADLPLADTLEQRRQICNDRAALLQLGVSVRSFAYPFGDYTSALDAVMNECGYNSARLVGGIATDRGCFGCPFAETIPPTAPLKMKTPDSIKADTTPAAIRSAVTRAENNGGGWVQLVFHRVCDGCNPNAVRPDVLEDFLTWLGARGPTTRVATIGDIVGGELKPAVLAPPAPPRPPLTNLLSNPSLETDSNLDGAPDCWTRAGFGNNAATWSVDSAAFEGSRAQRLDVSSWSDGARRLVSTQDLGSCAPSALPGHRYAFSAAYKASAQPRVVAYYRNAAGGWLWWAQSGLLATKSEWGTVDFVTPPLPSDGLAVSVGLSLYSTGTLTMDAFSLTDDDTTPPAIVVAAPGDAATVSGVVTIQADATDASGIARVEFFIDGNLIGSRESAPWALAWDTSTSLDTAASVSVRATDRSGNSATSDSHLVSIVSSAPSDVTAPSVSIIAPAPNSYVKDTTPVTVQVFDNIGVAHVDYLVDGALVAATFGSPHAIQWNTREAPEGTIPLLARAFDAAGNAGEATVNVIVDRTPPANVQVVTPAAGATVSGLAPINVTATDNVGIFRVRFFLDGKQLGTRTMAPWRWNWTTAGVPAGMHSLHVQVEDGVGNSTRSVVVPVQVN